MTLEQQQSSLYCRNLQGAMRVAQQQLKDVSTAHAAAQQQLTAAERRLQRARTGGAKAAKAAADLMGDLSAAGRVRACILLC